MERAKPTRTPLRTHHGLQVQQLLVQAVDVLVLHLDDKVQALQLLLPERAGTPVLLEGMKGGSAATAGWARGATVSPPWLS